MLQSFAQLVAGKLRESLVSNAIVLIVAVIMRAAKIKPVQRLEILLWVKTPQNPRTPIFYLTKAMDRKGQNRGRAYP
jgi:hypothetical protein